MLVERRHFPRSAFMADVPAQADGEIVSLFVYDLSMDGCMIQTANVEVSEGQLIVLEFEKGCTVIGSVLWRKNLTAGLQFETRLKPAAVTRLVEAAADNPYAQDVLSKLDRSVLKVDKRRIDAPGSDPGRYLNSRGAKSAK